MKAHLTGCISLGALAIAVQPAWAQAAQQAAAPAASASSTNTPAAGSSAIGEIVVTAQKRSERLQDVPMSIAAATSQQLQSRGITNTDQLAKLVPGFTFQKSTYGMPVYFIRGVGFFDNTLGVSPGVTVYTDQFPLPYSPMARGAVLDLERVEVLKGPQGTLFGENSTGGAVNYIAAKPTDHDTAGIELTGGSYGEADAEAYVSGPITDTLSARIAVRDEYQGDWQKGYTTDERTGEKKFINARLTVDWKPSDTVRFELMATGWRDRSDMQQAQLIGYIPAAGGAPSKYPIAGFPFAPNNDRAAAFDPDGNFERRDSFYQINLRGDIQLSDTITLTSLSSYAHYKGYDPTDTDATTYPNDVTTETGHISTFSQEVRFNGSIGDRLKWMVGGNYQHDRVIERLIFDPSYESEDEIGPFEYHDFFLDNGQTVTTKSGFGSVDYKLTSTLTAQASVRYSSQDRNFFGCSRDFGDGEIAAAFSALSTELTGTPQSIPAGSCITLSNSGAPTNGLIHGKLDQDNVSWRGGLDWKVHPNALLYANVTKGYKAGSFPTLPAAVADQLVAIPQESLVAYEAGFKISAFSHHLQLDGAGFYYDYRKKQLVGFRVVPPFGNLAGLVSIPKSRVEGGELNLMVQPINGLTINANGTYIESKILRDPLNPTGPFGNSGSFVGDPFPYTPKWQGVFDTQYRFPVSSELYAFLGGSVTARNHTTSVLLTNDPSVTAEERLFRINGYSLIDLRAGIESASGVWRLEFWGRNVTNKFYVISSIRSNDYIKRFTGMPATFGATLKFRFGAQG